MMRAPKFSYIALSFYLSSSGVIQAAAIGDTSSAMVNIQSNNSISPTNISNTNIADNLTNTHFDPFTIGRYTFNGEYSPSESLPSTLTAHDLLQKAQSFLTVVDDLSVSVRVGQRLNYYAGTRGEVEVSFLFLMEGGQPYTYHTVNIAISTFRRAVEQRPNIDAHPIDVTISEGGYAKIRCTISKPTNWQQARITTGAPLYVGGFAWPSRRIDARGTRNILDGIKDIIVRYAKPSQLIEEWWGVKEVRPNLILVLDFLILSHPLPPIKYEDVYELVDGIEDFLNQQPSYCELYGPLVWDSPGTPPEIVGYFSVAYLADHVRPLAANSTRTAMDADASSFRSFASS